MEKATFQDLIARKLQRDEDKLKIKEIAVPSLGKALLFKKPKDAVVVEAIGAAMAIQDNDAAKLFEVYKSAIYMSCDALKDTELHKELGVVDPLGVVQAIFDPTEIMEIGGDLLNFFDIAEVDAKVKN